MAAAIFNHAMTAAQALMSKPTAQADSSTSGTSGTNSSSDASSDSATISANDFLTLLVTEMQNQDPTADTDPNEYINQLVEVNSLEQLIDINQTLTTGLDGTSSATGSDTSPQAVGAPTSTPGADPPSATSMQQISARAKEALSAHFPEAIPGPAAHAQSQAARLAPGNLGIPLSVPAAQRVASALNGRVRTQPAATILPVAH